MTETGQGGPRNIRPRVLVVDDDENLLRFLEQALVRLGFEVIPARSGADAVGLAEETAFDTCLLDLVLPDQPGRVIIDALLKIDPGLDIIIMTGYASIDSAIDCMKAGARDYVQKPLDMNRLEIILRWAIEKKELKRKLEETLKTRELLVHTEKLSLAGKFAATILHEMNNPLSFIVSNLRMVRESLGQLNTIQPTDHRRLLEDISKAIDESIFGAERISELVSGLARVSMQPLDEESSLVELDEFVSGWLEQVSAKDAPGAIEANLVNDRKKRQVRVAPASMITALNNILTFLHRSHSRKAAGVEPRIVITLTERDDRPAIEIGDASVRLSEQERLAIFDPRIDLDHEDGKTLRMDIGLAIASRIAASQQADLQFESDERGTAFRMLFAPVAD